MLEVPQAILFDFDGVLADTEPLHWQCWSEVLRPLGVAITWKDYQAHCIGISDRQFLEELGRLADPPRQVDELLPAYPLKQKLFHAGSLNGKLVPEEVKIWIQTKRSVPVGVVTSSAASEIAPILQIEGLLPFLSTVVYGDDVAKLKPDPEPYLTAMKRLGVKSALVLEDSVAGVASARAAGCEVLQIQDPREVAGRLRARLGAFVNFR
ncbi:MAG: HAD family phosphatase [Candidatus Solibacter usitatus]|nr:HAD family phosphatase [Candidatus Solibacter usitatus]